MVPMIYGCTVLFGGKWSALRIGNRFNLVSGVWISLAGFLMVVPLRAVSLRHEFRGAVKPTTAGLGDLPDDELRDRLARRLAVVASLPEHARSEQLDTMLETIRSQTPDRTAKLGQAREDVLAQAPPEQRERLMATASSAHELNGRPCPPG